MKYGIYSILSRLSQTHDGLFLFRTELQAQVVISRKIPSEDREYSQICRVGDFDIETGIVTPYSCPIPIDYHAPKAEVQTPIKHGTPEQIQSQFVENVANISS